MEQVVANGLYLGAQYALIALGLTLIFALMNVLNFAHGQMYVLGGFVTYEVYGLMKLPFVVALLASAVTLAVLGAFGEKQRGVPKIVNGVFSWDNLILPWDRIVVAGLAILFIVAFILMMQFTKPGRAMRALAQDRVAAQLMGVPVQFYGLVGFALGAMLAGLAGGLLVTITGVNSGIGGPISIKAFMMVMIGGAGVVGGAIAGGFILGMLESVGLTVLHAYGDITYLAIFVALIIFLSIRPNGLMGKPWG